MFNAVQNHGSHGTAGRSCPKLFMVPPSSISTTADPVYGDNGRVEVELVVVMRSFPPSPLLFLRGGFGVVGISPYCMILDADLICECHALTHRQSCHNVDKVRRCP